MGTTLLEVSTGRDLGALIGVNVRSYYLVFLRLRLMKNERKTSDRCITQLAKMSIDSSLVQLTVNVLLEKINKIPYYAYYHIPW